MPDARRVPTIGAAEAFGSRIYDGMPSNDSDGVVIEYQIDYLDADSAGPEQGQAIE